MKLPEIFIQYIKYHTWKNLMQKVTKILKKKCAWLSNCSNVIWNLLEFFFFSWLQNCRIITLSSGKHARTPCLILLNCHLNEIYCHILCGVHVKNLADKIYISKTEGCILQITRKAIIFSGCFHSCPTLYCCVYTIHPQMRVFYLYLFCSIPFVTTVQNLTQI